MLAPTLSPFIRPQDEACPHGATLGPRVSTGLLCALLDEIDYAVFLCDADLTLRFANRSARLRLSEAGSMFLEGRRLHGPGPRLASVVRRACESGRRELVALRDDHVELLAAVVPVADDQTGCTCAAVILGRRADDSALAIECLSTLYGLSLAEREVLSGLRRGQRTEALARHRGVGQTTVRTQIAALRDKLGRSSVTGLMNRLADLPPMVAVVGSAAPRHEPMAWPSTSRLAQACPVLGVEASAPTCMASARRS